MSATKQAELDKLMDAWDRAHDRYLADGKKSHLEYILGKMAKFQDKWGEV